MTNLESWTIQVGSVMLAFMLALGLSVRANAAPRSYHRLTPHQSWVDDKDPQEEIDKRARKFFKTAKKKLDDRQYWRAAVDLIVILDFFPTYSQGDDVVYWLGNCLYEMEMYDGADRLYRHLLKDVGRTKWVASALLGLQKSAYQKQQYDQSLKFYKAIEAHYAQTASTDESRYYAGQTYFSQGSFDRVLNVNSRIRKKSDFYAFGLYTVGLTHLKKGGVRQAIRNFLDVIELSPKTPERQDIIDSARLTVSYLFFELSEYERSLKYVSQIGTEFPDYSEALLLRAWNSVKMEDYQTALSVLKALADAYPRYYNMEEAHFLRGQCFLKLGYYDFAITEYGFIIDTEVTLGSESGSSADETRIEQLNVELGEQEAVLMKSIPIDGTNGSASLIADNQASIQSARESLIRRILFKRQEFNRLTERVEHLKKRFDKNEMRKRWRTYAEYGRARALFLKGTESK